MATGRAGVPLVSALRGEPRAAGPERRTKQTRSCIRCPHRRDCKACPVAVLSEPAHEDAQRIPDYLCAFNWTLMGLRKRFPVQAAPGAPSQG